MRTPLIASAIFALASRVYPSTIVSYDISTNLLPTNAGTPCSKSGTGIGSATCSSIGDNAGADASVTLTDNSLHVLAGAFFAAGAEAFASITHDDFYSVPVNGPVSALVNLICAWGGSNAGEAGGHFSLGSMSVSPPVESLFLGASHGSGPCGALYQIPPYPPSLDFAVSLSAMNNIVHLHTYIDGAAIGADSSSSLFVQLKVNGFQDANGNAIQATLLPEPASLLLVFTAVVILIGLRRLLQPVQARRPLSDLKTLAK